MDEKRIANRVVISFNYERIVSILKRTSKADMDFCNLKMSTESFSVMGGIRFVVHYDNGSGFTSENATFSIQFPSGDKEAIIRAESAAFKTMRFQRVVSLKGDAIDDTREIRKELRKMGEQVRKALIG